MEFRITAPCKGTRVFDVIPKQEVNINMSILATKLEEAGYRVDEVNNLFLIASADHLSITVYRRGRIVVKEAKNEEEAKEIGRKIYSLL